MADFDKAFRITIIGNEGGYNPGIGEHETYMGIDRGANPQWGGWKWIDNIKANNPGLNTARMNALLSANGPLQQNIRDFYKTGYWDTVKLDQVNDQQLANNLFDCSVNQGDGTARKFMQLACNYVITAIKSPMRPLEIDSIIGPQTIATFNALPPAQLNAEINLQRELSYHGDAGFAEWGAVWLKRLKDYVTV